MGAAANPTPSTDAQQLQKRLSALAQRESETEAEVADLERLIESLRTEAIEVLDMRTALQESETNAKAAAYKARCLQETLDAVLAAQMASGVSIQGIGFRHVLAHSPVLKIAWALWCTAVAQNRRGKQDFRERFMARCLKWFIPTSVDGCWRAWTSLLCQSTADQVKTATCHTRTIPRILQHDRIILLRLIWIAWHRCMQVSVTSESARKAMRKQVLSYSRTLLHILHRWRRSSRSVISVDRLISSWLAEHSWWSLRYYWRTWRWCTLVSTLTATEERPLNDELASNCENVDTARKKLSRRSLLPRGYRSGGRSSLLLCWSLWWRQTFEKLEKTKSASQASVTKPAYSTLGPACPKDNALSSLLEARRSAWRQLGASRQ